MQAVKPGCKTRQKVLSGTNAALLNCGLVAAEGKEFLLKKKKEEEEMSHKMKRRKEET